MTREACYFYITVDEMRICIAALELAKAAIDVPDADKFISKLIDRMTKEIEE